MPTVGIYVPQKVFRSICDRWDVATGDEAAQELVRILCADSLESHAGVRHEAQPFIAECEWASLHRDGIRCRHCGGI